MDFAPKFVSHTEKVPLSAALRIYIVLHVQIVNREVLMRLEKDHKQIATFKSAIKLKPMRVRMRYFDFSYLSQMLINRLLLTLNFLFFPVEEQRT